MFKPLAYKYMENGLIFDAYKCGYVLSDVFK